MKNLLRILSYSALIITVAPGFLVFNGIMEFEKYKIWVYLVQYFGFLLRLFG